MKDAFDWRAADFSAMTQSEKLYVSHVIHQAFVDVDEKGTKAAAATAVVWHTASLTTNNAAPIPFHADHPFLFLLRDNHTGHILFMGRMTRPDGAK